MARPREFDVDMFLDQALAVFWVKGFASTSMADIYAATQQGPGSVYAIVKDKDALFRRVFERYAQAFRASMASDLSGLEAIETWLGLQVRFLAEDPERKGCLIANTIMEREAHKPETHRLAQQRIEEIRDYFLRQVQSGRETGSIRRDQDPEQMADALLGSVTGIMALARARVPGETLMRIAASALEGLRPSGHVDVRGTAKTVEQPRTVQSHR